MNDVWDEISFLYADKHQRFAQFQLCFTCFFCFILYIDSDFLCSNTHSFITVKDIGVAEPGTQLKILSQLWFFSTACLTL